MTPPVVRERDPRRPATGSTPAAAAMPGPASRAVTIDDRVVVFRNARSYAASQYYALRHLIEEGRRHGGVSMLAVTSPDVGEGKTTTAINLAGALAQASAARVLLIDADLRRPAVARRLGLQPDHAGLAEAILDRALSLAAVAEPVSGCNLAIVRAGGVGDTSYEVLHSPRVGDLLQEARTQYDFIIVDTAPLLPIPDARIVGKWVDGFLLVVGADRTPRKMVEESLNLMAPEKVIGIVFNGDDRSAGRHDYYEHAGAAAGRPRWPGRLVAGLRGRPLGGNTPWR